MKILVFANFDVGLYKFRKELLSELLSGSCGENEVWCALPNGDLVPKIKQMGCKFIETPLLERRGMNPIKDIRLYWQYLSIIGDVKPDYIITYTVKCNIYGGMAARRAGIPYSLNVTGLGSAFQKRGPLQRIVKFMYSLSNPGAKRIFFENVENAQVMREAGLAREDQIVVNSGAGVNIDEYPFTDYPVNDGVTRFLFIGRVMREKGVDELFACAKRLKEEYGEQVEFHIVGPLEENYSMTVEELARDSVITFYGYQGDVKPMIEGCNCFVLPSYHEGMANSLLECGSMGRPLITTNIHGCKEAVVKNESGFLVDKVDEQSLYDKLKKFIELPHSERVTMGKRSREHIEEVFDKKKVVANTISALDLGDI